MPENTTNEYHCVVTGGTYAVKSESITVTSVPVQEEKEPERSPWLEHPLWQSTLTFETNGGSDVTPITRLATAAVSLTRITPTREGYRFTGWYADEALTHRLTVVRLVKDATVWAGWEAE